MISGGNEVSEFTQIRVILEVKFGEFLGEKKLINSFKSA